MKKGGIYRYHYEDGEFYDFSECEECSRKTAPEYVSPEEVPVNDGHGELVAYITILTRCEQCGAELEIHGSANGLPQ